MESVSSCFGHIQYMYLQIEGKLKIVVYQDGKKKTYKMITTNLPKLVQTFQEVQTVTCNKLT